MTQRLILTFATLALLSQTGCVAAIPLAMQLVSGANSSAQLCSMTKMPGQTTSLCDRIASSFTTPTQPAPLDKTPTAKVVTTAQR
jgi:hypothetical protein